MYFNLHEISSSDDEDMPHQYQPRRQKLIRDRIDYFNILTEEQFFARFRLQKLTVLNLLGMIENQISPAINM